jgi:hypothetical protein
MEKSRQFNQEQKLVILESAKEVGIKDASRIAGVHTRRCMNGGTGWRLWAGMDFCHT